MQFGAGKMRFWRFASVGRPAGLLVTSVLAAGCASARPEVSLPDPRTPAPEIAKPDTMPVEGVERGLRSNVTGSIGFLPRGSGPLDLGATIVSLRPKPVRGAAVVGGAPVSVRSITAEFAPSAVVARPKQPVVLRNDGPLVHRLFIPGRRTEAFTLDPEATSDRLVFQERGPVRFFCSLHTDETFVVFIEDAPYVAIVSADGTYDFGPVLPGRYTLAIWSERVSGPVRELFVDGVGRASEPIWLVRSLITR